MYPEVEIQSTPWWNELWGMVRLYRSLRVRQPAEWFEQLATFGGIVLGPNQEVPVSKEMCGRLIQYLNLADRQLAEVRASLRSEEEALQDCKRLGVVVDQTRTRNVDHHQSSKALVAEVSQLASRYCLNAGITFDTNPQRRAVWLTNGHLHVSARNLDGGVPRLLNPFLVWEIKEYWGKTNGGSKMSDAVYECQLIGLELREFERLSGEHVYHVVFLDGREQWDSRKSDLVRFIDLANQGLIDRLIVGKQVAFEWPEFLRKVHDERQ